jgi:hypothetical protein
MNFETLSAAKLLTRDNPVATPPHCGKRQNGSGGQFTMLFSVFYSFWVANLIAFNADVCRNLAVDFLTLAEKQRATLPPCSGIASWALP